MDEKRLRKKVALIMTDYDYEEGRLPPPSSSLPMIF
jgi:hypothetical protein